MLQAFAAVGHAMEPNLLADPVITTIAQRVHKTPAQVVLAGCTARHRIPDHLDQISAHPRQL